MVNTNAEINSLSHSNVLTALATFHKNNFERIEYSNPINRNYSIVPRTDHSVGKLDLLLISPGRSVNLRTLMPHMYGLLEGNRFFNDPEEKVIFYDKFRQKNKGFILSLLHEIAHANLHKQSSKISLNLYESLTKRFYSSRYQTKINLLKLDEQKNFDLIKTLESYFDINTLPPKAKSAQFQLIVQQERDAWASALRMARSLEKQGFNVLGEFKDNKEIFEYITFSLATYEYVKQYGEKVTGSYTPLSKKYQFIR